MIAVKIDITTKKGTVVPWRRRLTRCKQGGYKMRTMLENLINGNLTAARKQARRFSHAAIRNALMDDCGYSANKAALTADWLKTGEGRQQACDAD